MSSERLKQTIDILQVHPNLNLSFAYTTQYFKINLSYLSYKFGLLWMLLLVVSICELAKIIMYFKNSFDPPKLVGGHRSMQIPNQIYIYIYNFSPYLSLQIYKSTKISRWTQPNKYITSHHIYHCKFTYPRVCIHTHINTKRKKKD